MRKIKEVLRLKSAGMSNRKIATSCGISRSTVGKYLDHIEQAGLTWPLPNDLTEAALENQLYPNAQEIIQKKRPTPDWAQIHKELRHKNVTLFLLWEEYREKYKTGYQYSWFTEQYRQWSGKLDLVMRQNHLAGEKLFGLILLCQIFISANKGFYRSI